tara:strand:- start:1103 stop:1243 length:141 start_codon:yes stop_codon:yes gene_type:complete
LSGFQTITSSTDDKYRIKFTSEPLDYVEHFSENWLLFTFDASDLFM